MPGIVGFSKDMHPEQAEQLTRQMSLALEPDEKHRRTARWDERFGLGMIEPAFFSQPGGLIWDNNQSMGVAILGEIFGLYELEGQHLELQFDSDRSETAVSVLKLYREMGDNFAYHLNGHFSIALWDGEKRKLLVTNDRLGLQPIYYTEYSDGLFFASGIRALLANPALPRDVDDVAVAEFLTFEHLLRQRTFLRSVRLLSQGSVLTFRDGHLGVQQYWKPSFPGDYPIADVKQYSEEFVRLIRQAARRQIESDRLNGILLSGGLDSRVLLAFTADIAPSSVLKCYTWAARECADTKFAAEAARTKNITHEMLPLDPGWLQARAQEGIRRTDGMANIVNLHALDIVGEASKQTKFIAKGIIGDIMLGFAIGPRYWARYGKEKHFQVHLASYRDFNALLFDPDVHERAFTGSFYKSSGSQIEADYKSVIADSEAEELANQRTYIDLTQRAPRHQLNGAIVMSQDVNVRIPFCDNDLLDFALRIPPAFWQERQVMAQALIDHHPSLAQIPFTPRGLPIMSCARDIYLRAKDVVGWHLNKLPLSRFFEEKQSKYSDYDTWFREDLRPWMEEILLSPRCLNRGFLKPEVVKTLHAEHMQGQNHAGRIGAILTLELWHRMYLD